MKKGVVAHLLVTKTGKTHESILTTRAKPAHLHVAALLLGANTEEKLSLSGQLEWKGNGTTRTVSLHEFLRVGPGDSTERAAFPKGACQYTGSREVGGQGLAASSTGSIISLIADPEALINSTADSKTNDEVHFPSPDALPPKVGIPAELVLVFSKASKLKQTDEAGENQGK